MKPFVAELRLQHAPALLKFYSDLGDDVRKYFQPFREVNISTFENHLRGVEKGKHLSLGLIESKEIFGHCFILDLYEQHPILGLGVDQSIQNSGHGKALLEGALARADRMSTSSITLTVVRENERALHLYKSVGFVIKCLRTFRVENDSYLMERIHTEE